MTKKTEDIGASVKAQLLRIARERGDDTDVARAINYPGVRGDDQLGMNRVRRGGRGFGPRNDLQRPDEEDLK